MAYIPAPNTAKVSLVGNLHGQTIVNSLCVERVDALTPALLQDAATVMRTWYVDSYRAYLSDQYVLMRVEARDLSIQDGHGIEIDAPTFSTGLNTSGSMPANVALSIKKVTGMVGRTRRGRWYLAAVPRGVVVGSSVTNPWANMLVESMNYQLTLFQQAGWTPVVVSYQSNKIKRTTALTTPITSYVLVDYVLDSQRRRLPTRGI